MLKMCNAGYYCINRVLTLKVHVSLSINSREIYFLVLNVSFVHFVTQQTIRELFDMNDGQKKDMAVELSVPQAEEEETVNKQNTTILEQVRRGPKTKIQFLTDCPMYFFLYYSDFKRIFYNHSFCRPCVELRMRRTLWQPLRPKRSR